MLTKGPGHRGSILGWVMSKTQKMVLYATLLNIQHYKIRIKGKWRNPGKRVAPSPTPQCSSYRKGSPRVAGDHGRPTHILTLCIYIRKNNKIKIYEFMNKFSLNNHRSARFIESCLLFEWPHSFSLVPQQRKQFSKLLLFGCTYKTVVDRISG